MNTSEVLNRAADLIQERGWTAGPIGWGVGESSLCIEGALSAASVVSWHDDVRTFRACPAVRAVQGYLGTEDALWQWNDAWDGRGDFVRTQSEVIEVLRAAAVIEAAREEQDAAWTTYAELVTA